MIKLSMPLLTNFESRLKVLDGRCIRCMCEKNSCGRRCCRRSRRRRLPSRTSRPCACGASACPLRSCHRPHRHEQRDLRAGGCGCGCDHDRREQRVVPTIFFSVNFQMAKNDRQRRRVDWVQVGIWTGIILGSLLGCFIVFGGLYKFWQNYYWFDPDLKIFRDLDAKARVTDLTPTEIAIYNNLYRYYYPSPVHYM